MNHAITNIARSLFGFAMLALIASEARAALIIDVIDTDITVNSTGFVNVLISSTGTDNLAALQYKFRLTEVGTTDGTLEFVNPQSPFGTDPDYVFFMDTNPIFPIVTSIAPDEYIAADGTGSGNDVSVDALQKLLVRLEVKHALQLGSTPLDAVNDQYEIALVNDLNTFFFDSAGGVPLTLDSSSFNPGTMTITAAVPEPVTTLVLAMGLAFGGVLRRLQSSAIQWR